MLANLAFAYGAPELRGEIRQQPDDFFVAEISAVEPSGEGEHVLLHIEKRGINTAWLAEQLARYAGVPKRDVSFAGLKDRQAVTRQWFSVGLAGKPEPDWSGLELEGVTVLQTARHRRKLRRGALQGNRFQIRIRNLQGDLAGLQLRLVQLERRGVPNYFGEQRFGREGRNLEQALTMFQGRRVRDRNQRSLYLSAARSFLFNELLSRRVDRGDWDQPLRGDVMLLDGSNSYFVIDEVTEDIRQRCREFDIHPGGCLWGRGESPARLEAAALEQALPGAHPELCQGLEQAGLERAYRPLRLMVRDFRWQLDAEQRLLQLEMRLPAGAYATTVLRELVTTGVSA
ncbi:MAG: tRNA pseudouridine(13) synthase TruD [Proteobacteria bacterium]|jgi:tRNA pseudouridine13 synthase|nr:tRNA pseudouridine(13) synthase TruD [Pseudomonadota bacterium]